MLLSYEYEAITANKNGEELEYVIPDDTIKINIDIATTKDAPESATVVPRLRPRRRPAQEKFADWGYRPVNETVLEANKDKFPDPPGLFTIEDLGGWEKVNAELFDIEGGAIAEDRGGRGGVDGEVTTASLNLRAPGRPAGRPRRSASRRCG